MSATHQGPSPAVHRATAIAQRVSRQEGLDVKKLAEDLSLPKSTVKDVVGTMLEQDILARRHDELVIGSFFADLTTSLLGFTRILDRFAALWQRQPLLSDHTLSIRSIIGREALCLEVRHGRRLLPYSPRAGFRTSTWDGIIGEPALRSLHPVEVEEALDRFELLTWGFDANERTSMTTWIADNCRGSQLTPMLATTGNYETNVSLRGARQVTPLVLTLHLPPSDNWPELEALCAEMTTFAAALTV